MVARLKAWANQNEGFVSLIGVVIGTAGLILTCLGLGLSQYLAVAPRIFTLFEQWGVIILAGGLLLALFGLHLTTRKHRQTLNQVEEKLRILENLPDILLDETAAGNLSNWDTDGGQWASDQEGLSVKNSLLGGICKIGSTWENYELTFDFRIIQHCAAWFVRAKPLRRMMIQCTGESVRPHILFLLPTKEGEKGLRWTLLAEIEHGLVLKEWNSARTEVVGHGIKVRINDKLVWSDSQVLKDYPMGSVGFRCARDEHALFKHIKVTRVK